MEGPARRLRVAGIALLVIAVLVAGMAFAGVFDSDEAPPPGGSGVRGMTHHANRDGGYAFSYPSEWKLRDKGTTSTVTAPDSEQIVSFGNAPRGSLRRASRRFLAQIVGAYEDPVLSGAELQQVDGHRALAVAGEAINDAGVDIRFLTVTVVGGRNNYGIVVYTNAAASPTETLPVMQAILDSFRIRR